MIKSQNICTTYICIFPGSNGQDFPSKCHLERDACEHRRSELTVRYAGNCNPCQGFECETAQQECHVQDLNLGRTPSCTCDRDCANETAPICASNGKTVRNINMLLILVIFTHCYRDHFSIESFFLKFSLFAGFFIPYFKEWKKRCSSNHST